LALGFQSVSTIANISDNLKQSEIVAKTGKHKFILKKWEDFAAEFNVPS
jgi:hypothetical protein